jgi:ABC-2 type transport system ATP-binding protein
MKLEIQNLSKTYSNGVQALKNVFLSIENGMFGLLGPNGAGKSTLMRTLATLQEPDEGAVTFDGIDLLKQKNEIRKILGYLPQEFGLDPKASARDLLDHFAALKGIAKRTERHAHVDALLRQTNLWDVRNKRLGVFSGGMKQRFGIAQALLGNPKLLIVDEPTAGLDPEERNRFHNLLSEIGEHVVVILSTHIVDDVSDLCSRMAIIHKGELLLDLRPREALANLKGRIFRKEIERSRLPDLAQEYFIISTRLSEGKTVIRVLSDGLPDPAFEPVEAELVDVYFSAIRSKDSSFNGYALPRRN